MRVLVRMDFGADSGRPIQEDRTSWLRKMFRRDGGLRAHAQDEAKPVASWTMFARAADRTGIAKPWPKSRLERYCRLLTKHFQLPCKLNTIDPSAETYGTNQGQRWIWRISTIADGLPAPESIGTAFSFLLNGLTSGTAA
jgi:hypothetical protein